jgi:hypothetical protein
VPDPHRGRLADAIGHHEQDGGDLKRDLMRCQREVLINPIKSPAAPNMPYSSRNEIEIGAPMTINCRIRSPVDAPDVPEDLKFPERPGGAWQTTGWPGTSRG